MSTVVIENHKRMLVHLEEARRNLELEFDEIVRRQARTDQAVRDSKGQPANDVAALLARQDAVKAERRKIESKLESLDGSISETQELLKKEKGY